MKPLVQVLIVMSRVALSGMAADKLQAILLKVFKLSSALLAFLISLFQAGRQFDLGPVKDLVGLIASQLVPNVYIFIPLVQQAEAEIAKERLEAKRLKKAKRVLATNEIQGSLKIRKESKLLPSLIFNIELFDRYILEFSRKCKVVLVDHLHRSTARDFKIQTEELEAALEAFQLQAIAGTSESESDEPAISSMEGGSNDINS